MKFVHSFFAVLVGLAGVTAWAQDSLAGAERFTAADGGRVAYDKGVLTVQGQFITSEVNVSNPPSVESSVLATISGKPVMKQATWKGQTTAVATKFSASKDTYTVGGAPYVIISAGPQTAAGFTSVGSVRIINMATRAVIGQGGNLNPGFVISGTDKKTVLVRAVGPGLAALGVSNTMADPIVTVYSGSTIVGSNDNWSANATQQAALESAFTAAGAFKLSAGSKDAALLLTLAPGSYTAVAKGADNGGGELIVEVYEVP
jgi:hypothetical protein